MRHGVMVLLLCLSLCTRAMGAEVWLETLDLKGFIQAGGEARANRSIDGKPLTVGGRVFAHGVGTNAGSDVIIDLSGQATRFEALVGVDDDIPPESQVVFRVLVDGVERYNSGCMRGGDAARQLRLDIRGARWLRLRVDNAGPAGDRDHADWLMARIQTRHGAEGSVRPRTVVLAPALAVRRTPHPGLAPRLCGTRLIGARPDHPFLYTTLVTGRRPMQFRASGLPPGLTLDPGSGRITGSVSKPGTWDVSLRVSNASGSAARNLRIVIGPTIGLTPALGWNSWNVWGSSVDDAKVRAAADALVRSGLASHGFTYVNIDDGWASGRDASGNIVPNEKFPDMPALAAYVHSRGLKLGIYSSPGPKTCAGYEGSFGHEAQDARTFAAWGVDYLKYDWCSCTNPDPKQPYAIMRDALLACPRDIVFSMCQYGNADVWTWGAAFGNSWRTTGDIDDVWGSVLDIGFRQNGLQPYAEAGHFNDPDMLVVGWLGWGPHVRKTRLDPNEQYTHLTLWSLLSAPLLIGCDLNRLDDFTLGLLSNDEVIDIDQDPLARQGWCLTRDENTAVWGRPLADGSWALGFFNLGFTPRTIRFNVKDIALLGHVRVRDVWRQRDLGTVVGKVQTTVAPHGVELVRVSRVP